MNNLLFEAGVTLVPDPGGARMIWALENVATDLGIDLVITAGSNGVHSGPEDPHYKGRAFDVRSHNVPDHDEFIDRFYFYLGNTRFYVFLEDPGTGNEHFHAQVAKGTVYP